MKTKQLNLSDPVILKLADKAGVEPLKIAEMLKEIFEERTLVVLPDGKLLHNLNVKRLEELESTPGWINMDIAFLDDSQFVRA